MMSKVNKISEEVERLKARLPERRYQDRYTKRSVTLYIVDGEARVVPPRCQNKRHYRDLSRFP